MQQFNPALWFDENNNYKGVEHLPEELNEPTMWQVMSMLPLGENFINKHIGVLDLTLLFINNQITKNILMNKMNHIIDFMIDDPSTIEDIMLCIMNFVTDGDHFTEEEEEAFATKFIAMTTAKYTYTSKLNVPHESIAGSLEAYAELSRWISTAYLEILANTTRLSLDSIHPDMRVLFMMVNIHVDVDTIEWEKITADSIQETIEEYSPVLLSPFNDLEVVMHVNNFTSHATMNSDRLIQ